MTTSPVDACDGVDDDCDGAVDEDADRVALAVDCLRTPREQSLSWEGITWDAADAASSLTILEGLVTSSSQGMPWATVADLPLELCLGEILMSTGSAPTICEYITVGDGLARAEVEVGWSGRWLLNLPGDDVVVGEYGSHDYLAVQVVDSLGQPSARRLEASDTFFTDLATATKIDFSDYGIAEGDIVMGLRLSSVAIDDHVLELTGTWAQEFAGVVVRPGEPGYDTGVALTGSADNQNAEPFWVSGLHPVTTPECCVMPLASVP